jgi:hypothetical protein
MNLFVLYSVYKSVSVLSTSVFSHFSASTKVCQSLITLCFPSTVSEAGRSAVVVDLEVPIGQATIIDKR